MFSYAFLICSFFSVGPTSFAPMIEGAIRIVEQSGGQYHVLLIIADGQVANLLYRNWLLKQNISLVERSVLSVVCLFKIFSRHGCTYCL